MSETSPSSVTPLEGKTTIDDKMFFEPERLSYKSADKITLRIADAVGDDIKDQTVVIAGTRLLADLANLRATYLTLHSVAKDYRDIANLGSRLAERRAQPQRAQPPLDVAHSTLIAEAVTAAIAPATSLVTAALGLLSFFREDVEYHGAKTTVDSLAFEIALAAKLKSKGAKEVIVPDLMVISTTKIGTNSLSMRLAKAQKAKSDAWAAVGPMISELVRLEAELDEAARRKDQERFERLSALVSDLRRDMHPVSDPLSRADQRLASLLSDLNKTDESSEVTLLARLLRAEVILDFQPKYVHAKVVSSGGHHRISRSLLRTIFVGDGLSFSGGAVVRWALLEAEGSVKNGGILVDRIVSSFSNNESFSNDDLSRTVPDKPAAITSSEKHKSERDVGIKVESETNDVE